jgi:hypothetical protein
MLVSLSYIDISVVYWPMDIWCIVHVFLFFPVVCGLPQFLQPNVIVP